MKTKPILIVSAVVVVLLVGAFFLFHQKKTGYVAEKSEIAQFLNGFNNRIKEGNTDSLLTYFATGKRRKGVVRIVFLLAGRNDLSGLAKPFFNFVLDIGKVDLTTVKGDIVEAAIPASFSYDSLSTWNTILNLKIRKVGRHKYKIIQVASHGFLSDYALYENLVKKRMGTMKDMYSAITLAAFKTAAGLKTRYDSVLWFAHLNNKTWFYVARGKWYPKPHDGEGDTVRDDVYKMGLLNPDLKEVIPVEYDLIHNINGTFDGLVEVEKSGKKGFFNLDGKVVVPVNYDQIYPIDDDANMAVLRNGSGYFYLKKDTTISEKVNLKISDFFAKIRNLAGSYNLMKNALSVVTEYNSTDEHGAIYVTPSYLVDMNIAPKIQDYKNPLRNVDFEEVSENYEVADHEKVSQNWFQAAFYSIRDYFLGGRSEFYDRKNLVIVDKKTDKVFTTDIGTDYTPDGSGSLDGPCDINSIRQINDSLYEVKAGAALWIQLYDTTKEIQGGPYYHYLLIHNNKLTELPDNRNFGFTKYVKMDDSYLEGCYNLTVGSDADNKPKTQTLDRLTPEILRYIKNEIYADYRYQFKDKRWQDVFGVMNSYNNRIGQDSIPNNTNVDDSLTAIDKYNINWIVRKLSGAKAKINPLASK